MAESKQIHLSKLENTTFVIEIVLTREFRFRMWLSIKLMGLAGWVLGCPIEVTKIIREEETYEEKPQGGSSEKTETS